MNTESAYKALEFCGVLQRSAEGCVTEVLVPGHEGAQYRVEIHREHGEVMTRCYRKDPAGERVCLGNSRHAVCYHSLAAILLAAHEKKQVLYFCETEASALRMQNFGGRIVKIRSRQGSGRGWVLVRQH